MGEGKRQPSLIAELTGEYRVPLVLVGCSIVCIIFGVLLFVKSLGTAEPIRFSQSGDGVVAGASTSKLTVDVAGAVVHPGVYSLSGDARVDDAIVAAGGLTKDADTILISKVINRASKLSDGAKLYIPFSGEVGSDTTSHKNSFATEGEAAGLNNGILPPQELSQNEPNSGYISINSASQSELESLNGVGPVTAGKIISNRPYTDLNQLVEKKAMSASLFSKLAGQLSL